jgi:tetratricopeptide (TPR) repeat protein
VHYYYSGYYIPSTSTLTQLTAGQTQPTILYPKGDSQFNIKTMSQAAAPTDYVKKKHTHAAKLEDELSMLPPKTSESKKAALRVQLCELYSDMLLHDPHYAARKDSLNRLWRNCFYGHISELRRRLAKEEKIKSPKVTEINRNFTSFLEEAIKLYDYLVREYSEKLTTGMASSQASLSAANMLSSQDSEVPPTPSSSMLGVVNNLFRMYIHMGDLYRYSKDNDAAEKCYHKASKLAPGKGNPYNQMAVVAALKDTSAPLSCLAFFYYARSLLAVDDPFETARSNLMRLLEQNRVWLVQTPVDVIPTGIPTKKATQELQRLKKSAASKRCLANFVDLHYDFVESMDLSELEVIQKFSKLLDTFRELVAVSAFGDSLLMKMAAVNAFSVTSGKEGLARTFTLRFGAMLGERLEATLAKSTESQTTKEPSVRLLSPFMLLAEYCLGFSWSNMDDLSELVGTEAQDAESAFWTQVAAVANLVERLVEDGHVVSMPRDYDGLRGYKPFCDFIESPVDVYVTPEDAVRALGLDQSQTPASTTTSQEETRVKLAHFMKIVSRANGAKVMKTRGSYVLFSSTPVDNEEEEDAPVVMDDSPVVVPEKETPKSVVESSPVPSEEELDEAGDVLMYKPSGKDGSGPALLVPGAFLLNILETKAPSPVATRGGPPAGTGVDIESLLGHQTAPAPPELTAESLTDPMDEDVHVAPQVLRQPPGLSRPRGLLQEPPPGFASPMAEPYQRPGGQQHFGPPPGYYQPPPLPPGFSPPVQPTMYDSLYNYPIQTANPFYNPLQPLSIGNNNFFQGSEFLNDLEGTSFLDKSLLDQLWSDDSSKVSKNPFLT